MKIKWECIYESESDHAYSHRSKIPGGWLVRHREIFHNDSGESLAMVFVPDKNHEWEV